MTPAELGDWILDTEELERETKEAEMNADAIRKETTNCFWTHVTADDPRASTKICPNCFKWITIEELKSEPQCKTCNDTGSVDEPSELSEWCTEPAWCNCDAGKEARAEYESDMRDQEEQEREMERSWR